MQLMAVWRHALTCGPSQLGTVSKFKFAPLCHLYGLLSLTFASAVFLLVLLAVLCLPHMCLQVVEKPAGQAWADEFGGAAVAAAGPSSGWASEFQQQQQRAGPAPPRDWADEFANGVANIDINSEGLTDEQLEAAWAAVGGEQLHLGWRGTLKRLNSVQNVPC
jgi:hypothetical protein